MFNDYVMKYMVKRLVWIMISTFLLSSTALGGGDNRWEIQPDGSIIWNIDNRIPHYDHIEMSGEQISAVLRYGVNGDGSFRMERSIIWSMLRTLPNDTHASLTKRFAIDFPSLLVVDGTSLKNEQVRSMTLDGCLKVVSDYSTHFADLPEKRAIHPVVRITRTFFPSVDKPLFGEQYVVKNLTDRNLSVMIPAIRNVYQTDASQGLNGSYTLIVGLQQSGSFKLKPGEEIHFDTYIQGFSEGKQEEELLPDISKELLARKNFVREMWSNLVLETPDRVIDRAFAFAKIRASESIYRTAGGLMHGPGGEAYYAAIWANDESEYMAPFYPFLGYRLGNEATLNAYRLYMKYMNDAYEPVPSSIIAEGTDTWQGAGDCGDAAMLAYGGIRYALTRGEREEAEYLWPLMEWCLEYCNRKLNKEGVVESDADELEGRFPSGNANILVSSMYYDALISAGYLAKELGLPVARLSQYAKQAAALRKAIESYFGANVEGFETYSYYQGNDLLRSWICAPLYAGIEDRAKETIDAIFSRLWTRDGLLSQSGTEDFWDRSTWSAIRAGFVVGEVERMTACLSELSNWRLLGDHVPYPIEAWPEGNQRHLSGESGLYCRIITEGMFGIRPTGFRSFILTPRLPAHWDRMALRHIKAFGQDFDIEVVRKGKKLVVKIMAGSKVIRAATIKEGDHLNIKLPVDVKKSEIRRSAFSSEKEELIVCGGHKILVIDPAESKGNDVKINWQWDISEATQLPDIYQKYLNPLDECKPVDGNTKLLVTASGGGVVLLDRKTKDILFYAYSPMAHSAELLPGGRIAVALSTHPEGNSIELYDIRTPEKCLFRDTIYSGHGVVWVPEREYLYVLGGYDLRAYSLKNWKSEQPELQLEKSWRIPGESGHDLSVISKNALLLTEAWGAWVFYISEERFSKFTQMCVPDMKSVNYDQKTKRLVYTKGENDEWWTHHIYLQNPDQVIRIPDIELYKVRVNTISFDSL